MRWFIRIFAIVVLLSMLAVTSWASLQCSVLKIPREVGSHPWFIATLFDTYWAFFTFFLWFAYKETAWWKRAGGFVLLVLLGNIFMAAYLLVRSFQWKQGESFETFLLRRETPA
jgi:hypothetical protein